MIASTPCQGAKFVLQKLKNKYNLEIQSIYLNAGNKQEIYERYNLDNLKIPCVVYDNEIVRLTS
jgi:hypothetical protein